MRQAAAKNDMKSFSNMAPTGMKPAHVKDMFNDTRNGMKLHETTTAAVGGLGYNAGNPATDETELTKYTETNAKNSEQISQTVSKQLSDSQNKLSKIIGFKEYQPKNTRDAGLTYWDYDENGNPLLIDAIKKRAK